MLDTKLRNGKKNGAKWAGILITALASILFVVMIPEFERKAQSFYEASQKDIIEGEDFIASLIQCNYVLYRNVMDKTDNRSYAYEELFLSEEVEDIAQGSDRQEETENSSGNIKAGTGKLVDIGQMNSIRTMYADQIEAQAKEAEALYTNDIGQNMDYYVFKKGAGTVLKNTALPIDALLQDLSEVEEYVYYIIMDYDTMGNLQNISVRGQDADKLLKMVQTLESGSKGNFLQGRSETEIFSLYDGESKNIEKILTVEQQKPEVAVFIYAMTKAQIEKMMTWDDGPIYLENTIYLMQKENSYYFVDIQNVYLICLFGILLVTVLLTVCKPALLQGEEERKAYLEVVLAVAFWELIVSVEGVIWLIQNAGTGEMLAWINTCFPFNLQEGTEYEIARYLICFLAMTLLFGIWYFCCLEISDILRGFRKYLKTRCLVYKGRDKIFGTVKNYYGKLKAEVLSIDLGKDMSKLLTKLLFINFCLLVIACLCSWFGIFILIVYTLVLYYFLKKYIHKIQDQYGRLLQSANSIAQGNLNNTFTEDFGIFESYKEELYKIQDGLKNALEEEVKSQKMKTELITNVSHDLKTPLTAIITYIDLLKEENTTQAQRKEYLDTLARKSLRLKILIEDLFEVSKATSGNVKLEPVCVDICHLMRQVYLEYEEKMRQAGLKVRFEMPEEKTILYLDPQKTYRIFENLYVNIIKYALPDTRVFIVAEQRRKGEEESPGIHIELKNISAQEIFGNPQDLSERFVRGDASRNTEGSGLGLAIAKSFTELQGGRFKIETDADLFKVILDW